MCHTAHSVGCISHCCIDANVFSWFQIGAQLASGIIAYVVLFAVLSCCACVGTYHRSYKSHAGKKVGNQDHEEPVYVKKNCWIISNQEYDFRNFIFHNVDHLLWEVQYGGNLYLFLSELNILSSQTFLFGICRLIINVPDFISLV